VRRRNASALSKWCLGATLTLFFASAQCLSVVWQHVTNNQAVSFSPGSDLLATGGGGTNIWHAFSGSLFETLDARFPDSRAVGFSPDGAFLAGGSHSFNQNLNLWRVADGVLVTGRVTAHNNGVESLQFSPSGPYLATGGRDAYTRLWHVPELTLIRSFPTGARTFSVAFSPDGSRLVTGGSAA
jgi:WD40 repeat protein